MTTTSTSTTTAAKPQKSFSVSMKGGDDATLRFVVVRRKQGAVSFAVHSTKGPDGKRTNKRGATEQHPSVEAAVTAIDRLVKDAAKLGWTKSERKTFGQPQPDAFDAKALPAPAAAVPAPKPTTRKK